MDSAFTARGKESYCRAGNEQRGPANDAHCVGNFAHVSVGDHQRRGWLDKRGAVEDNSAGGGEENTCND